MPWDPHVYTEIWIPELIVWLAQQLGMRLQWLEVVYARNRAIRELVRAGVEEQVVEALRDPGLLRMWSRAR